MMDIILAVLLFSTKAVMFVVGTLFLGVTFATIINLVVQSIFDIPELKPEYRDSISKRILEKHDPADDHVFEQKAREQNKIIQPIHNRVFKVSLMIGLSISGIILFIEIFTKYSFEHVIFTLIEWLFN